MRLSYLKVEKLKNNIIKNNVSYKQTMTSYEQGVLHIGNVRKNPGYELHPRYKFQLYRIQRHSAYLL